ncbi:MAG: O-antigen ligase family protein [Fimbriimonas sp.]
MSAIAMGKAIPERKGMTINLPIIITSFVVFFYTLLPLDRGFPTFPLMGRPLSMAVVASGLAIVATFITSRGAVLQYIGRKYVVYQTVFFIFLIVSSFLAPTPLVAIQHSLRYFCTFVVNYILFLYLIERYGPGWLNRAAATAGILSAIIAIVDTFGGFRLPIYATFFEAARIVENAEVGLDAVRGIGTMGNPILMSALMLLAIPYVFEIRFPAVRAIGFVLICLGAATTVSRTFILGLLIYFVGWLFIYRTGFLKVLGIVFASFLLLGVVGVLDPLADDPRVQVWQSRMGLGGSESQYAASNISTRQDASKSAIRSIEEEWGPTDFLTGKGAFSSAEVGEDLSAGYNTIDNTTITILYERGLLAVIAFYASFVSALIVGRRHAFRTLHWWAPIAMLACGISFDFEAYTTFNILLAGSVAIITARTFGKPEPVAE